MAKNLMSKIKTGAMIGLAGLALAGVPKAHGTIIEYVNTTISGGSYGGEVDQDPSREGVQLRYDWEVKNQGGQGFTSDAIFQYTIQSDLESRGMYGFTNNAGTAWSSSCQRRNESGVICPV